MKKISPKIGLFIVIPVILGMLALGLYMRPSGQSFNDHLEKKNQKEDSLKKSQEPEVFKNMND